MNSPVKSIETPLLEIGYLKQGPSDGKPIILLHGWPYDAHTWDAVAGPLAEQGRHTFALYLRGFGPTRFLDDGTRRSGQMTAIAQDAKDFADALGLDRFTLAGYQRIVLPGVGHSIPLEQPDAVVRAIARG